MGSYNEWEYNEVMAINLWINIRGRDSPSIFLRDTMGSIGDIFRYFPIKSQFIGDFPATLHYQYPLVI